jgi:hypothetical protein
MACIPRKHDHEVEFYAFDMLVSDGEICVNCRCQCGRQTWRGYWRGASSAST